MKIVGFSINLNKFVLFAYFALDFLKKPTMLLLCNLIQEVIVNLLKFQVTWFEGVTSSHIHFVEIWKYLCILYDYI